MSEEKTPNETNSAPVKKKVPTWVWIVAGVLVFGLILQSCGGDDPSETDDSSAQSEVAAPEAEEEPQEVVAPSSFANLEELETALALELGEETNMGLPRELALEFDEEDGWLNVSFVINENFTTNMTRRGAWREIATVFDYARKADFVNELTVSTKFPLINNLGEELGPQNVVVAYFDSEVFPRINPNNLPGESLGDAATSVMVHPALRSD